MNWEKYIEENKDKEWKVECDGLKEPLAQDDLVLYFMFFDTEN